MPKQLLYRAIGLFLFFPSYSYNLYSQCNNPDFETGNWTGWTGWTGYHPNSGIAPACCPVAGFPAGRFTIVSGAGTDPCGGFPVVAAGGSYSLKIGNNSVGAEAERLKMSFTVTAATTSFSYQYAVVLQDPGHPISDQPYFEVKMTDGGGSNIPCSYYYVAASQGIPGMQNSGTCFGVIYKPWSTVNIDLSPYIGQTVTVQFTVADCAQTGHYGYAYLDASCIEPAIIQYDSLCNANSINIYAPSGAASYLWTPGGDSTQSMMVSSPGNYCVQMTSQQGCLTNICHQVNMYQVTSSFAASTVCFNDTTFFTDLTTGGVSSWNWDFGDTGSGVNNISLLQHPTHVFSISGTFQVRLIAGDTIGCADTVIEQVTVNPLPTADFFFTDVCLGSYSEFIDLSSIASGVISSWEWDFGDGFGDVAQNPQHLFSSSGNYNVELKVISGEGCSDSLIKSIMVYPLPVADFVFQNTCEGDITQFFNISTIFFGTLVMAEWDFGDSSTSFQWNPYHTFPGDTLYMVTMSVISDYGCNDSISKTVEIYSLPATPTITVNGNILMSSSTTGNQWYLNGNPLPGDTNQINTISQNGFYYVAVTNQYGCTAYSDSILATITSDKELFLEPGLLIFPNPAGEGSSWRISGLPDGKWDLKIFNAYGNCLAIMQIRGQHNKIDAVPLSPGIYFILLMNERQTFTGKLIRTGSQ